MNRKAKGSRNERRSMKILEAAGYACTRSAASLGAFDIIGIRSTDFVVCQVKTRDWPAEVKMEEIRGFRCPPNCRRLIHRWRDLRSKARTRFHGPTVRQFRACPAALTKLDPFIQRWFSLMRQLTSTNFNLRMAVQTWWHRRSLLYPVRSRLVRPNLLRGGDVGSGCLLCQTHISICSAALWSHAVQDRGPILSGGVGEPPTGSDLSDGRCRGRKNVGGIGRKRGRFGLEHSQKWQNRALPWAREAPNAENPTAHCIKKR
jgi:hypothetical protein